MSVLNVRNMTKAYSEFTGVFNLDLNVEENDIVLLLGPNGAGKTTAFRGVLGLTEVDYDKASVFALDIEDEHIECLKHIGAMVSKPVFYDYLTGYEHLKMMAQFYDHIGVERIQEVFEIVGLVGSEHKLVSVYSTGMKQRLDLARAILHKPRLMILDEPFSGMDIEAKAAMKSCLKKMQAVNRAGVLISSHMVGDLEGFANKVVIIYQGRTLFNGSMQTVRESGLTLEEFYLEKLSHYKKREV